MAISFVGATYVTTRAAALSKVLNVPGGVQVGDMLLLVGSVPDYRTASVPTAGWTQLYNATGRGLWYKVATAGDVGGTVTLSSESSSDIITAAVVAYSGAETTPHVHNVYSSATASTAFTGPTVTTTAGGAQLVHLFTTSIQAGDRLITPDSPLPDRTVGGNGVSIGDESQASAGTSTARAATSSASSTWSGFTVALADIPAPINDPRDIPGLVAWYSAEAETGYADGAAMTQWTDLSGNGNHATPVSGQAPIWKASGGPGGGEYVDFSGNKVFDLPDNLMTGNAAGTYASTWYATGGNNGGWNFSGSGGMTHVIYGGVMYDTFGAIDQWDVEAASGSTWYRYQARAKSGEWKAWRDGSLVDSRASNTVSWATTGYWIGMSANGAWHFNGRMAAFVLYDHDLTNAEIAALDAWQAANPNGGVVPDGHTLAGRLTLTGADVINTTVDVSTGLESGEPTDGAGVLSSWLEWTAPRDGRLTLTVDSIGGSAPRMAIYEGDPSSFAGLTLVAATATGLVSPKTLEATGLVEGETYYIQVGTDSGSSAGDKGVYGCMFDNFSEAKPIDAASGSQTGVHTFSLTTEAGENTQPAGGLYGTGGTFWMSYTPATSGTLTLTNNSGREIMGGVYTGASLPGTLVQGWRTGDGGTLSQAVTAGTTYLIQFARYGSAPDGELSLGWSGPAPGAPPEVGSVNLAGEGTLTFTGQSVGVYSSEVLADSPLAYYRLGEASGTTMVDFSGNGRNGVYAGSYALNTAGLLASDADTCVDFTNGDGSVADAAWMDVAAITVECLVNLDATNEEMLVERDDQGGGGGGIRSWQLRCYQGNFQVLVNASATATAPFTVQTGVTYHVAATFDGNNVRLYVNGVLQATTAYVAALSQGAWPIYVGRSSYANIWPVDGRVDEVAIYGTALSGARIAAHHAAIGVYSSEVLADSPLGYWRLGESSGTTMVDSSGNGRDGAYSGSPTLGATGLLSSDADTAVDFDGANDVGEVPEAAWQNVGNATIEAWVRPDTVTGTWTVFSRRRGNSQIWLGLRIVNGQLRVDYFDGAALSGGFTTTMGSPLQAGVTYHLAVTVTTSTVTAYVDGAAVGTGSLTNGLLVDPPGDTRNSLVIGMRRSSTSQTEFFDGVIDEVAFYGSALSQARIQAHYNAAGPSAPAEVGAANLAGAGTLTSGAVVVGAASGAVNLAGAGTLTGQSGGVYSTEVLADSPLAYWRMGDLTATAAFGTAALDLSGNSRAATYDGGPVVASSLLSGDSNGAMAVTANAGTRLTSPSASWMDVSQLTVECLFNLTSAVDSGNGDAIVSRYTSSGFTWMLWRNTTGKLAVQLRNAAGTTYNIASAATVSLGTTYHAAFTVSASTVTLYVDGASVASTAIGAGGLQASTSPVEVGRYSASSVTTPGGVIDEVAIYGSALSAARIAAHYNAATGTAPGAANLAGVGTLTLAGQSVGASGSVSLAGQGTLTLLASIGVSGAAALSGEGALTGQHVGASGAAALSGSGTLTATGITAYAGAVALSGSGSLTLSGTPVVVGYPMFTTEGATTVVGEQVFTFHAQVLILDDTLVRAPTALTFMVTNGWPNDDVQFDIDGTNVLTASLGPDGTLGATSVSVPEALGAAGVHTLTVTSLTESPGQVASDTFTFAVDPTPALMVVGPDAEPVAIPAADLGTGVYRWVLQDLMPGGLGSYVMPSNPVSMTNPHYTRQLAQQHTTSVRDGQYHISEPGGLAAEWQFSGVCLTEEFYTKLVQFSEIPRRFYIIDHRNRAWTVAVTNLDMRARLRTNVDGSLTDWAHDYTVTALLYSQNWTVPQ